MLCAVRLPCFDHGRLRRWRRKCLGFHASSSSNTIAKPHANPRLYSESNAYAHTFSYSSSRSRVSDRAGEPRVQSGDWQSFHAIPELAGNAAFFGNELLRGHASVYRQLLHADYGKY